MNNVLVDTNILVYSIDEDSIFHSISKNLILSSEYKLYTTSKNLSEFLVVLTRGIEVPVSIEDALSSLEDLITNFTILYPSNDSYKRFRELLIKYNPKGLKIHDFEIMSICLENEINKIATMDKDDFKDIDEIELITVFRGNK
ncbi:MAG: type II toxin-antitoxin system VapC family toxin [Candidatus Scalindua rubra]|uniref:PIN domain protein n=1 Tax=Candidatus Scalindua brodae TaxID=237368 RepID=A0A0B0ESW0_9BACT|nr:MAG: PIN domain protein [Candidatus Scalindua brodae]MBZ0107034.1 type II toxin-antitoxin system VapC family toxin [Candidatus Scalindua rubra]